jgi:hypothetical protein
MRRWGARRRQCASMDEGRVAGHAPSADDAVAPPTPGGPSVPPAPGGPPGHVAPGLERLVFFSDAVFAIAITLLALDLRLPDRTGGYTDATLLDALSGLMPSLFAFALSFVILATFWLGHFRTFRAVVRSDGWLVTINLVFLFFIALLPFPTSIVAAVDLPCADRPPGHTRHHPGDRPPRNVPDTGRAHRLRADDPARAGLADGRRGVLAAVVPAAGARVASFRATADLRRGDARARGRGHQPGGVAAATRPPFMPALHGEPRPGPRSCGLCRGTRSAAAGFEGAPVGRNGLAHARMSASVRLTGRRQQPGPVRNRPGTRIPFGRCNCCRMR